MSRKTILVINQKEEMKSLTSDESSVVKISNLKKKYEQKNYIGH